MVGKGVKMDTSTFITPMMYMELVEAKAKVKILERYIQKELNNNETYASAEFIAAVLGIEKEKNNESNKDGN